MLIQYSKGLADGQQLHLTIENNDNVNVALAAFAQVCDAAEATLRRNLVYSPAGEDVPPVPIAQAIEEAHAETTRPRDAGAEQNYEALARLATATEDEAAQAMRTYYAAKGVPAAVQLLAEFGVARVTDMNPEQRGAFVEKVRRARPQQIDDDGMDP